jgi:hypothetical protein
MTVYCDLTLGADYYVCDGCEEFWRHSPSEWAATNALSYSFDWHPGVGYCDGGEWQEQSDAGSLEECWEACMPDDDDDDNDYYGGHDGMGRFAAACANWNLQEAQCYCMGEWSTGGCRIDDTYQGTLALGDTVTGDTSGSCSMIGQESNDHFYLLELDEATTTSCDGNSVQLSSCGSSYDTVRADLPPCAPRETIAADDCVR